MFLGFAAKACNSKRDIHVKTGALLPNSSGGIVFGNRYIPGGAFQFSVSPGGPVVGG